MFNTYEIWLSVWCGLLLSIVYWVTYKNRGRLVARVGTATLASVLLLFIFANYLADLLGNTQWAVLTLSAIALVTWFTYWFSTKYGKPPQKQ
jgi:accessory gene regulator protein AgrB